MNPAGVLEDIRGELERLRDNADSEPWRERLECLVSDVEEARLVAAGRGSGCSLCEAGHAPARPCEPAPDPRRFGKPPGYWAGRCCEPSRHGHLPCMLALGHTGPHGHEVRPAHVNAPGERPTVIGRG